MKQKGLFLLSLLFILGCSSDDENNNDPDPIVEEDTPTICEGIYPCFRYSLVSHVPLATFDAATGNDSWGWTDPQTNNEYVLMGLDNGTAFVDISVPEEPIFLGKLPSAGDPGVWRDIKVANNYAYIISEAPGHGMQVFDLTHLRNVAAPPVTFTADFHYTEFSDGHNLIINEDSGFVYAVGTELYNGGPHFINISDPLSPTHEGGYAEDGYTHDGQAIIYNGPDTEHHGKEIFLGSNINEVVILDVTDKTTPVQLGTVSYDNAEYTHQGWFTEDQRYFIVGDELDELEFGFQTRTLIFDMSDLDNPEYYGEYLGPTTAIDHNGYVKGSLLYLANYSAGLRVIDITDIDNFEEVGYFDTYPDNDTASFNGVWNVYPFFESGNIVLSDLNGGLFIIKKNN